MQPVVCMSSKPTKQTDTYTVFLQSILSHKASVTSLTFQLYNSNHNKKEEKDKFLRNSFKIKLTKILVILFIVTEERP